MTQDPIQHHYVLIFIIAISSTRNQTEPTAMVFSLFVLCLTIHLNPLTAAEEFPWSSILADLPLPPKNNGSRIDLSVRMDEKNLCNHDFCSCHEPFVLKCNGAGAELSLNPFEFSLPQTVTEVRQKFGLFEFFL